MTRKATFAVVIASHNGEETIGRAIQSAKCSEQLRGADEIIVVDDGSTDRTAERVGAIAHNTASLVLRSQENRGRCAARNYGAEISLSDYIIFLDDDDVLDDQAIQRFDEAANNFDGAVGIIRQAVNYVGDIPQQLAPTLDLFTGPTIPGSFALSRRLFDLVGGYDTDISFAENSDLLWRLHDHCAAGGGNFQVRLIDEIGVFHHRRQDGATHYRSQRIAATRVLLKRHEKELAARPELLANLHGVLAHDLTEVGETGEAMTEALRSVQLRPAWRSTARLGRTAIKHASGWLPVSKAA